MDALLVTIPDAAAMLAVSRSKAYQLVASGDIRTVKIGRSTRVRPEDIEAYVTAQLQPLESPLGRNPWPWELK